MEKEKGMEEHGVTPARQEFSQLRQLPFLSPQNQSAIDDYLTYLRARHYGRAMQEGTLRALKSFAVLMPEARQATLAHDLTQTTATDVDAWIEAAFRHPLAPSTVATHLRLLQGFFAFLHDQGAIAQSPIRLPRHHILVPQDLPRPMADDEVMAFFRVIDAVRDRTMFLLMLRCGLRVSEVSSLAWSALDFAQGTVRIDHSKGQVDRVVYLAPDVTKALRQWQRLQGTAPRYVFPSRVTRKGGLPLSARQIQNCMTRYLKLAGISKPYSPHSLRHTFATQLLNAGASLEVVKELMGHRSLDVTLRYTQLYDRTKRAQYDQAMRHIATRQGLYER
jgi:site-specific recombinase XerD